MPAQVAETRREGALLVLENAHLRVAIAPQRGGKILSLQSKRTGTEWLLPPLRSYQEAISTAGFEAWDGGGFDECLPTVAATATAPDHGEVWRNAWQEAPATERTIALHTNALEGALAFGRTASLDGATLALEYMVENRSDAPRILLYSAHPLLRVAPGDRIVLPSAIESVRVEGSMGNRLGVRGDTIAWPRSNAGEDLSLVGAPDGGQADKLFAGPVAAGWCALLRPSLDEGLRLRFPPAVLPYVGLWICRAAWPESGAAKQYTVALEPTSAPADSLVDAEHEGHAWRLLPGERRAWRLDLDLIAQPDLAASGGAR